MRPCFVVMLTLFTLAGCEGSFTTTARDAGPHSDTSRPFDATRTHADAPFTDDARDNTDSAVLDAAVLDAATVDAGSTMHERIEGAPYAAEALGNLRIGGEYGGVAQHFRNSLRFRAEASAPLVSFRTYLVGNPADRGGYASGNGGVIHVTLAPDDGSEMHAPQVGVVLADLVWRPGLVNGRYPSGLGRDEFVTLTFERPASLVEGQLYHLVFINEDAASEVNWMSLNFLYNAPREAPIVARAAWGNLFGTGAWDEGASWEDLGDRLTTPILQLNYASGAAHGCGYVASGIHQPRPVRNDGTIHRVSQTISFDAPRQLESVGVRLRSASGARVGVEVVGVSGESLARTELDVPGGGAWHWSEGALPAVLSAGEYRIVIAPVSGEAEAIMLQDGVFYGFAPSTVVQGQADFDQGAGWVGWGGYEDGIGSAGWGDLQLFLRTRVAD